jgi:hypothetical protein
VGEINLAAVARSNARSKPSRLRNALVTPLLRAAASMRCSPIVRAMMHALDRPAGVDARDATYNAGGGPKASSDQQRLGQSHLILSPRPIQFTVACITRYKVGDGSSLRRDTMHRSSSSQHAHAPLYPLVFGMLC